MLGRSQFLRERHRRERPPFLSLLVSGRALAICGKAIGLIVDGSSFINAPPEPRIAGRGVKQAALVRSRDTDLDADSDDIEFLKVQNGSGICVSGRVCLSAKVGAFGTGITIAIPKVLERAATAVVTPRRVKLQ